MMGSLSAAMCDINHPKDLCTYQPLDVPSEEYANAPSRIPRILRLLEGEGSCRPPSGISQTDMCSASDPARGDGPDSLDKPCLTKEDDRENKEHGNPKDKHGVLYFLATLQEDIHMMRDVYNSIIDIYKTRTVQLSNEKLEVLQKAIDVIGKLEYDKKMQQNQIEALQQTIVFLTKRIEAVQTELVDQASLYNSQYLLDRYIKDLAESQRQLILEKGEVVSLLETVRDLVENMQEQLEKSLSSSEGKNQQQEDLQVQYARRQEQHEKDMELKNKSIQLCLEMLNKNEEMASLHSSQEDKYHADPRDLRAEEDTLETCLLSLQAELGKQRKTILVERGLSELKLSGVLAERRVLQDEVSPINRNNLSFTQENLTLQQQLSDNERNLLSMEAEQTKVGTDEIIKAQHEKINMEDLLVLKTGECKKLAEENGGLKSELERLSHKLSSYEEMIQIANRRLESCPSIKGRVMPGKSETSYRMGESQSEAAKIPNPQRQLGQHERRDSHTSVHRKRL